MGQKQGKSLSAQDEKRVLEAWEAADGDKDGKLTLEEVKVAMEALPQLWAMLEVNTGLEATQCQDVATTVAMSRLDANGDGYLSWEEFRGLWTTLVLEPQNQLEFFHQTLFSAFDTDSDQMLSEQELWNFLDIFYKKSSIFAGDKRLPEKEELVKRITEQLDQNKDHLLSFKEIQPLLTGSMRIVD